MAGFNWIISRGDYKMSLSSALKLATGLALGLAALIATGLWLIGHRPLSVPILMYHHIGDKVDSPWWVTTRDFETQLLALREQGYSSVWPSDLVAHQRWGWPLPDKPIVLTFDDGYLTLKENAEPLLRKYGFKGVSYLITGRVGDSVETRQEWEGSPLLIWPEIKALYKRGTLRFGGHSRTHPNLRAMADARQEIVSCYRDLERKGGFTPEGFCYPHGEYKPETVALIKHSRFTTATTCKDGFADIKSGASLIEIPRVSVMGGRHGFKAELHCGTNGIVAVTLSKEGRNLEVIPKLIWSQETSTWLPQVQVTSTPATWTCPAPVGCPDTAPVLELWDTFRVIRYYPQVPDRP